MFWPRRFAALSKNDAAAARLHDAAAVKHDDVAGEPARFAEIMGRHHDLDAAVAHSADDVFHRLGGGRIEARGRLVEKQHRRIARERPRQRQPLLLAAGQPSRGAIGEMTETDQFEQLAGAARMLARGMPAARSAKRILAAALRRSIAGR